MPYTDRPPGSVLVDTYGGLDQFVRGFAAGKLNLLLVVGPPGSGKSRAVLEAVGPDPCWIDGNCTAFGLYCELYRRKDEPVIIDDVDSLYSDRAGVRLLKCLCQTETRKRIGWHSNAAGLRRQNIPRQFDTSSRVCIICNEWVTTNVNVAAVQDRGHVVLFEPTADQVHARVSQWFWDQEIFEFVGRHLHLVRQATMRDYWHAWELKRTGIDWRAQLLERWGLSGRRLLVARLKADPSYGSEEARARTFIALGGGCRATYYNHARWIAGESVGRALQLVGAAPVAEQSIPDVLEILHARGKGLDF